MSPGTPKKHYRLHSECTADPDYLAAYADVVQAALRLLHGHAAVSPSG